MKNWLEMGELVESSHISEAAVYKRSEKSHSKHVRKLQGRHS